MKIKEKVLCELHRVQLKQGEDYYASDLRPDRVTGGVMANLHGGVVRSVALAHGYDRVLWSGHEKDGVVEAVFRRTVKDGAEEEAWEGVCIPEE